MKTTSNFLKMENYLWQLRHPQFFFSDLKTTKYFRKWKSISIQFELLPNVSELFQLILNSQSKKSCNWTDLSLDWPELGTAQPHLVFLFFKTETNPNKKITYKITATKIFMLLHWKGVISITDQTLLLSDNVAFEDHIFSEVEVDLFWTVKENLVPSLQ